MILRAATCVDGWISLITVQKHNVITLFPDLGEAGSYFIQNIIADVLRLLQLQEFSDHSFSITTC